MKVNFRPYSPTKAQSNAFRGTKITEKTIKTEEPTSKESDDELLESVTADLNQQKERNVKIGFPRSYGDEYSLTFEDRYYMVPPKTTVKFTNPDWQSGARGRIKVDIEKGNIKTSQTISLDEENKKKIEELLDIAAKKCAEFPAWKVKEMLNMGPQNEDLPF